MKTKMTIKNQKGAAIVEFAIILPLVVLLVMGICEFGLLWYNSQVIINSSREGARAGIVLGADFLDDNAVKAIVTAYCDSRVIDFSGNTTIDATNDITLTPNDDRVSSGFGDDFLVEVEYDYGFLVPALFGLGITKKITGRTLMKMEGVSS